jgi:hypothetical protein
MKSGFLLNALDRLEILDDSRKATDSLDVDLLLASHLARDTMRPELRTV